MPLSRSLSLSALLLAASAAVSAAEPGGSAEALPAPAAPALQVAPAVEAAPVAAPTAPVLPATQAAPAMPALPVLPTGAVLGSLVDPQTLALLEQLRALQVTPQQAVGGVGALLGLAQSQLAAEQYAQLAGSVPGLELLAGNGANAASGDSAGGVLARLGALGGLLGGRASPQPAAAPVDSLAGVGQAFSLLGMDSSLVGPFGQILLQFLAGQGLAGALLQSLGGIWGVPGVPGVLAPVTPAGTPVAVGG
ncbi:DUF2780 domain-containing protein [Pseudomonas stutzeri]|nr:DUF2780 domain-containing protein [Stutzerimonas stutzeri]